MSLPTALRLLVAILIAVPSITLTTQPAMADTKQGANQCLVKVTGTDSEGFWTVSAQRCFATFAEVQNAAEQSTAADDANRGGVSTQAIIATHYDGANGTGASISITGSTCNGGGFNVSSAWNDRISSTTSSCHTAHYSNTNYGGSVYTTNPGSGVNLNATLDNQTSSIIYNP